MIDTLISDEFWTFYRVLALLTIELLALTLVVWLAALVYAATRK